MDYKLDFTLAKNRIKCAIPIVAKIQRKLVKNIEVYLNEEPRRRQCNGAILAVEPIMVGVKQEMIQVEEPTRGTDRLDQCKNCFNGQVN